MALPVHRYARMPGLSTLRREYIFFFLFPFFLFPLWPQRLPSCNAVECEEQNSMVLYDWGSTLGQP